MFENTIQACSDLAKHVASRNFDFDGNTSREAIRILGRESVIDEATSAVDTATELAIQRGLARLTEGRTTNVCVQELERHVENTRETAPEGSRPYRLHFGSRAALDALEDCETPLTR